MRSRLTPARVTPARVTPARGRRRTALLGTAVTAAFVAGLMAPASASAESNGGLRIMPLGDSITAGSNVAGGYRNRLWERAVTDKRLIDFVGTQYSGPATLPDRDNQGHSGYRIDQIDAGVADWARRANPRTVLLHIGTNDVNRNHDLAGAPARLSALIDHLTAAAPNADVFVASIIPFTNPAVEARGQAYNATIPGIVNEWVRKGRRVHFVDMHSALTSADLADGVHPTANGYAKMADRWYTTLRTGPWI
ncbi:SGNH/GDSL hydrolase family protein [Streptomyces liangshanensis]|uniref:SGNH/GDSL hydrolase family protein n=1 Tax=Streptomyces liangshanensis TaxID=2717324 RepID=UPI0036D7CBBC